MTHSTLLAARDILCAGPFCKQLSNGGVNAPADIGGTLIGFVFQLVLVAAGLMLLVYLMSGGIDWITSSGEKEKLDKARQKITHALIGMFIVVLSWSIWLLIVHDILGIFGTGGSFTLPTLGQ